MLNSALRRTLSEASIIDIVKNKRDALMADIRDAVQGGAKRFGLEVIDVRIKRADLPEENSEAVFRRMQSRAPAARRDLSGRKACNRAAADQGRGRPKGHGDDRRPPSSSREQLRGEGDGERNRIFAEAYGADPDFFAFYRSMQAYDAALKTDGRAIISPKSDFFRYFSTPTPPTPAPTPPPSTPAPSASAQ